MSRDLRVLAEACLRLKETPRRGWILRGLREAESVADHSFCLAMLAFVEAYTRGLDACKAMLMALIHDLPEAEMGDLTPAEKAALGGDLKGREELALNELTSPLSRHIAEVITSIYREYVKGTSEEAKLIRQLDKLEMAIQAVCYVKRGLPRRAALEFIDSAREAITDEGLKGVIDEASAEVG